MHPAIVAPFSRIQPCAGVVRCNQDTSTSCSQELQPHSAGGGPQAEAQHQVLLPVPVPPERPRRAGVIFILPVATPQHPKLFHCTASLEAAHRPRPPARALCITPQVHSSCWTPQHTMNPKAMLHELRRCTRQLVAPARCRGLMTSTTAASASPTSPAPTL